MSDQPPIVSPAGIPVTYEREMENRARQITKGLRQWLRAFAGFLTHYKLTLHCGVCHMTLPQTAECWRHWGECSGHKRDVATDLIQPVVKTSTGMEWLAGPIRPRTELRAGEMEWLRQFSDVAAYLSLGVHCDACQTDLTGLNADRDAVYSCACHCQEFIGDNREYVEPVPEIIH